MAKKIAQCPYCRKKYVKINGKSLCSTCDSKREKIHELYLACQALKKRIGVPYDDILDKEINYICKGE